MSTRRQVKFLGRLPCPTPMLYLLHAMLITSPSTSCHSGTIRVPETPPDHTSCQRESPRPHGPQKDNPEGSTDTLPPPLPCGLNGIAADYVGDVGLATDQHVLLFDDFESYRQTSNLSTNYDSFYQQHNLTIETKKTNVFSGDQSLEIALPKIKKPEYNAITKYIAPQDVIFVRFYTKMENGFSFATGNAAHNGVDISGGYDNPGGVPNGTDFFYVGLENTEYRGEAQPGYTHAYVYHMNQRSGWGDHWYPDGLVIPGETPNDFGADFVPRPLHLPETNEWYSVELMVQLNTPGDRDGRIAAWINGELIADWGNVKFRDTADLKIDRIQLNLGASSNSDNTNLQWFDNLVVAKSYIGPMTTDNGSDSHDNRRPHSS